MSQGWGFDSLFWRGGEDFCTQCFVPGEGFLLPSSRAQGFVGGRGLDEIDTCMSRRHVKSDMARPRQSTKLSMQV